MSDLVYISNTPIFDALMKERPIVSALSRHSSLRYSTEVMTPRPAPVLPVQDPRVEYTAEKPQTPAMAVSPKVGDQIFVRPLRDKSILGDGKELVITEVAEDGSMTAETVEITTISDTLMFHGVTAEEALQGASRFPEYVQSTENPHVFVKKVSGL
jgi:hypothetical protein